MRKKPIFFMALLVFIIVLAAGCGNQNESKSQSKGESLNEGTITAEGLTSFNTTDIYGEEFNQDIFKDYELTMVNVWGTFCGPCIEEMPSLGEIQKEYQDKGVNIVGIVVDVQDPDLKIIDKKIEMAKEIADKTGADYTHLIVSPEIIDAKIGEMSAIPASFFVDSEGNFVGETYVGARDKEEWTDIIEKTLEN